MTLEVEQPHRERGLLLALDSGGASWEDSLEELARLADTAGVEVVGTVTQRRHRAHPVYFVGKGKAKELRQIRGDSGAEVLLTDADLTPTQQRNLEEAADVRVVDRTGLILDIFAQRAQTREGKVQVELAQLTYLLPRLTGKGTELSRLGGGIGTRGPGETKLEVDRRRIRKRQGVLRKQVEQIGKRRSIERRHRQEAGVPVAALVGYTNAGKSTLLNALAGAEAFVEDKLFATLDPTIRRVALTGGRELLLADTVGFISRLPHQLVAAFRATLEEVTQADVLVHVVDAAHPQREEQMVAARRVLAELGCADKEMITAFNKCDLVEDRTYLEERLAREPHGVAISALEGEGLEELLRLIGERLEQSLIPVELVVPWRAQALVAEAHGRGRVLSEEFGEDGIALNARVPDDVARRLRRAAGVEETPVE
jgi:GTP-binding protein HflX